MNVWVSCNPGARISKISHGGHSNPNDARTVFETVAWFAICVARVRVRFITHSFPPPPTSSETLGSTSSRVSILEIAFETQLEMSTATATCTDSWLELSQDRKTLDLRPWMRSAGQRPSTIRGLTGEANEAGKVPRPSRHLGRRVPTKSVLQHDSRSWSRTLSPLRASLRSCCGRSAQR